MSLIIDYSTSRPSIASMHADGVVAVGRYIGWDGTAGHSSTGKNITAAEKDALLAAGIDIFLAFEYEANAAALGGAQGHSDATLAISQMSALGCPDGMASYFAVDFDIPDYAPSL
ncbi:MAG TPA: glycoside hydrolase domain-containing protein, partial [Ktedonobacteraceae bacterium]|nr:glycoside hydrolase domain-containing protein [Ktedonobacteraceae bacterium]